LPRTRIGYLNGICNRLVRGDKMILRPTKYMEWEEFKVMDSEAQFWNSVNSDFMRFFKQKEVVI